MTMVRKVGVVGCGTMGAGITQVLLEAGHIVRAREMDSALLEKGLSEVQKGLERSVGKGILPVKAKEEALHRLSGTLSIENLKGCDLIIEDFLKRFK
jgi:3-hydroxybutyryl-CoA dehydrogenase